VINQSPFIPLKVLSEKVGMRRIETLDFITLNPTLSQELRELIHNITLCFYYV
jgi:hypothetical protein